MLKKAWFIITVIVMVYVCILIFSNDHITNLHIFSVYMLTKPLGKIVAFHIIFCFVFGMLFTFILNNKLKKANAKSAGLAKKVSALEKELKQVKREYALQERKVSFLEDTLREETEEDRPPQPVAQPPKPKSKFKLRLPFEIIKPKDKKK